MRVLETGDWSLLLPDEWSAERDDEGIVIGDRDGVGSLEISELRKPPDAPNAGKPLDSEDLSSLLDPALSWSPVVYGSFRGQGARFEEDGAALREWVLYSGAVLLYITYSCPLEHRGLDDGAVDDLLATLRYAPDSGGDSDSGSERVN